MRVLACVLLLAVLPDDLTPIFNGKDLTGWEAVAGSGDCWEVRDGHRSDRRRPPDAAPGRKVDDF